jgi:Uma2 family endonuclease
MTITTNRYSIEDYLKMESKSSTKHEYWNGKIGEMAGGTGVRTKSVHASSLRWVKL